MTPTPVSILLAVYNGASTLRSAVESLRQQTWRQWELILVDDGSTDATASVATELAASDSRICVVTNDRNLGLAESLNRAFRMSSGEFIARMDADDEAHPDRFAAAEIPQLGESIASLAQPFETVPHLDALRVKKSA